MFVAIASGLAGCARPDGVVTIHPEQQAQVMRGWEATVDPGGPPSSPYLDFVTNDIGINRLRLEVRSGSENTDHNWSRMRSGAITDEAWRPLRYATVNDNDDPQTINPQGFDFAELDHAVTTVALPMAARLAARGEKLFVNVCYVAFTSQITTGAYVHNQPEEYAEFVLATYLHLRDRFQLTPDAWEVVLEPDNRTGWTGDMIGRAIVAAGARLRANGFTPAFIAPSVSEMVRAPRFIDAIAQVPGAMDLIAEISYHRYGVRSARQLGTIRERAERYRKPVSMLELWFGRGTSDVLREDLTQGNVVAWQGNVISGLVQAGQAATQGPFTPTEDTRVNRQYFQHVRVGAVRVASSGSLDSVAFVNPNGTNVVVLHAPAKTTFNLNGLAAGRYQVSYALSDRSVVEPLLRELSTGGSLTVTAPAAGVVTIAGLAN